MLVIEGTSKTGIGKSLAEALDANFLEAGQRIFPDGESEITIEGHEEGEDVVIVQTTYPFQDKKLLELYLMAHEMKRRKAKSITAVVPYLAYARQDKHFEGKNNIVSISAVLEMLSSSGVKKLVTVTPHKKEPLSAFSGKIVVIDPIRELAAGIKGDFNDPFILAPDKGALESAKAAASILECDYAHIDKQRDRSTGDISIINAPRDGIDNRDIIIIDDMISTGGTIAQAARFAMAHGAKSVAAAAVHLLMVNNAHEKMAAAGVSRIYGTNTVVFGMAKYVDVSRLIALAIKS